MMCMTAFVNDPPGSGAWTWSIVRIPYCFEFPQSEIYPRKNKLLPT